MQREHDAHVAAAEIFGTLVGVVGVDEDEVLEEQEALRQAHLIAAGHMLADMWRNVCHIIEATYESANAIVGVFAKKA